MKQTNFILTIVLALSLFSCKKYSDPSTEDLGYSYFPINEGDYSIYSVTDTIFNGYGSPSTDTAYLLKEEIHKPITVNDETRYQVYLYKKPIGGVWNSYPDSVWTEFNSQGRIIRVEDNVRFVKLVFPFSVGKSWDGNISDPSNDPQEYYEMKNIFRSFTYDKYSYPETVTVVQRDTESALGTDYRIEVYANNTGIVYKEIKRYDYLQSNLPAKLVDLGRHYTQKLIKHGRYK